jgi:hypothetical protein
MEPTILENRPYPTVEPKLIPKGTKAAQVIKR